MGEDIERTDRFIESLGIQTHVCELIPPSLDEEALSVVALHGYGETLESLLPVATGVVANTRRRFILLDLPGMGTTDPPPDGGFSLQDLARWIEDALGILEIQKADVFGFSFGALLWIKYLFDHPDFASKAILLSAGGIHVGVGDFPDKASYDAFFETQKQSSQKVFGGTDGDPLAGIPNLGLRATMRKLFGQSLFGESDFKRMAARALILYGEEDRLVSPLSANVLQRGWTGSQVHVLPGVGHPIPAKRPDEVIRLSSAFLNEKALS